jgi:hypothetical protein
MDALEDLRARDSRSPFKAGINGKGSEGEIRAAEVKGGVSLVVMEVVVSTPG